MLSFLWFLSCTVPDAPVHDGPALSTATPSASSPSSPLLDTATVGTSTSPRTTTPAGVHTSARCEALAVRADGGQGFYESNPTYHDPDDHTLPVPVASPEDLGLARGPFERATRSLDRWDFVDSFQVIVDGAVVWEHYGPGDTPEDSHNIHSASKSVLAAATGIALDQGWLQEDDTVEQWLPETTEGLSAEARGITVRQLLEMTGGFRWVEDHTEARIERTPDWVRAILELPIDRAPGTWFHYNTGHTHVLAAVLQQATGRSLCDFVHDELFDPMGIAAEHWGRDPQGIFSGGYNVYLTPRELAQFGLLVRDGGRWDGAQLVPEAWVDEMLAPHQADPPYGYGLLWWTRTMRGHHVPIAWGYGGQFVYWVPDLDLMVVITTDTHDHDPWFWDAEDVLMDELIPAVEARNLSRG